VILLSLAATVASDLLMHYGSVSYRIVQEARLSQLTEWLRDRPPTGPARGAENLRWLLKIEMVTQGHSKSHR